MLSSAEHFEKFMSTLKTQGITQYDYFVNWQKVLHNITPIEKELNLLNSVIGKENIQHSLFELFKEYPKTIKAIPVLLAIRDKSIHVLIDHTAFIYRHFDFLDNQLDDEKIQGFVNLLIESGFCKLLQNRQIKSIPDYCIGVEVGLDSNGRKNRGGILMERLTESFIAKFCQENNLSYLSQANAQKIKNTWNIDIRVDKSSRILDFVIKKDKQLYFIECNFYGGGGSKLKSTATEYIQMSRFWQNQNITFIWVTDGKGWQSTRRPLQDYFEKDNLLLNIEMLENDYLEKIIL